VSASRKSDLTEIAWWSLYLAQCALGVHRGCATTRICWNQIRLRAVRFV
jgi:hypothetical protein